MQKHLLGLENVSRREIEEILETAFRFREVLDRPIPKVPTLRGKTIVNLFFEPSTRTRISFELAEKRLSADTVNFSASVSSVSKGETLRDTIRNIEAMKMDMVVIRHSAAGAPHFLTRCIDAVVINGHVWYGAIPTGREICQYLRRGASAGNSLFAEFLERLSYVQRCGSTTRPHSF